MVMFALLALCLVACVAAAGMRRSGSPGLPFAFAGGVGRSPGSPFPSGWRKGRWQFAR